MTEFRLWAPSAQNVQLRLEGSLLAMQPLERGWWSFKAADAAPGMDYSYVLDSADPLPDPRSPWQPMGVHGPSRVVDHSVFAWTDQGWKAPPLSSAVLYELHVGTFTAEGTFDSAAKRLGYLANLGITHVEMMPVNEFPGEWGWGYDGVDLFAPHHAYGGPDGLKRLVNTCHAAGLAVLLDVVYNHLGPSGNYLARFGPYFTSRYSTPWGPAVNLDGAGSTEVRRFLCDNALMWLRDYHFDGLRIDAVHAIFDSSAVHFLEQLASEVKALEARVGRHLVLIAESDLNDPRLVTPQEAGGYGLHAQWNDDFHHALHAVLTQERSGYYSDFGSFADLAKALKDAFVYDGRYSVFRNRNHGRRPVNLPGFRFIGFLQNHDQVGNRARGERSSMLMNVERLKVAAAVVLCAPFIPMLFQGEEYGAPTPFQYFTNHKDAELALAVSEGRRSEFAALGWRTEDIPDPQDPATFLSSKLAGRRGDSESQGCLIEWHRRLIALRRAEPDLTDGRLDRVDVQYSEEQRWLAFRRGAITLVCNLHAEAREIQLSSLGVSLGQVLLSSSPQCRTSEHSVVLPPDAVVILKLGA
jgi:maltooligosyltrehalose trehalohydrolase